MRYKSQNHSTPPQKLIADLKKAGRAPLILGDRLRVDRAGMKRIGREYYYPSTDINNIENLFIYGQSGSGKTWAMMNLIGQSFFKERRCWVIIDSKGSYRDNFLPNNEFAKELDHFGLKPQGIPKELITVCAPEYYINGLSAEKIKADQITHSYRIPLPMANIPIIFEITKLASNTQYAQTYNIEWKKSLARTHGRPTRQDLYQILGAISTAGNSTVQRWTENLIDRIRAAEDLTLCENPYSPIGAALLQSAYDHFPRWIVMTFKHAETSEDPINLAIFAAILKEIQKITDLAKDKNLDLRVGLCVDEMQYYCDKEKKDSEAYKAVKEAIYRWGRSNRLFRMWGTQRNGHLDPLLQDDINKFSRSGTYQKVINLFQIKDPGYCSYMDRQKENRFDLNLPYLVPYIKTPPPMFQIKE